ncbi:Uncharacterised protein [uncultured archaeon]|nr:Uncharacterised protein [uncultured archaeon]
METKKPLDFFQDLISLKKMLVLYRDNPGVPFGHCKRKLT